MQDKSSRTEEPTPRRLERARQDGQVPASKEFAPSLVFLALVWLLQSQGEGLVLAARTMVAHSLLQSFRLQVTVTTVFDELLSLVRANVVSLVVTGSALTVLTAFLHVSCSCFAMAWKKLSPDLKRLSPGSRLQSILPQNFVSAIKAAVLVPLFGYILYRLVVESWNVYLQLPRMALSQGLALVGKTISDLLRRAAVALFVLGCIDMFRQRQKWKAQLRMTKHEIREEQKESEGSPLIRMRIRRLQREALRRRMMQQVPNATAVVVNPTHFAVAIVYHVQEMAAPRVVAKGKNWLALRIRETAVRANVPIIENPPLAQALYGSVEVGQEIPPHLYQAVAEVLAYVFRLVRRA